MAVGQMAMSPDVFYSLTPAEFIYAWIGWMEHQENQLKQQWELKRWGVWVLTSIQLDKKDRLSMAQMFPLPWDIPSNPAEEISMEERRARAEKLLKSIKHETDNPCGFDADYDLMQSFETDAAD